MGSHSNYEQWRLSIANWLGRAPVHVTAATQSVCEQNQLRPTTIRESRKAVVSLPTHMDRALRSSFSLH